jgi:tetratricopeptide (TPR) repeat protein
VTVLVIFYFITRFEVSSLLFVGFQLLYNLVMTAVESQTGVAYAAHSSGYLFGIAMAFVLLGVRLLPRDPLDMLNLFHHARRRQQYRRMVSEGYSPFRNVGSAPHLAPHPAGRWVEARTVHAAATDTQAARELELRREIAAACARHDLPAAADKYLQLVQIAEDAVLARQSQLDVANQLMAGEQYPAAADAYERFLKHYRSHEHAPDIDLMLGLLYGRYLQQYDRAEQCLTLAIEKLQDARKVEMARGELQAVRNRRGL